MQPAEIVLHGSRDTQRVLVTGRHGSSLESDLTALATFESLDPAVASVTAEGLVSPRGPGQTTLVVRYAGHEQRARVRVEGFGQRTAGRLPDGGGRGARARRVQPGCLPRLSPRERGLPSQPARVRPRARLRDLDAGDVRATDRRLRPFREPRAEEGHAPGTSSRRTAIPRQDDTAYRLLHDWIVQGCRPSPSASVLTGVEVLPSRRYLHSSSPRQQLVVRARFDDGSVRDVTDLAVFSSSNEADAPVTPRGLVEFRRTAETVILVRYLERIVTVPLTYVRTDPNYVATPPSDRQRDRPARLREAPAASASRLARRRGSRVPPSRLPRPDRHPAHAGGGHPVSSIRPTRTSARSSSTPCWNATSSRASGR